MLQKVATSLVVFAALMLMALGLSLGMTNRYLEPDGAHGDDQVSSAADPFYNDRALECGSPWSPRAVGQADRQLSSLGYERCTAVLSGIGWPAAVLVVFGGGLLMILAVGLNDLRSDKRAEEELARSQLAERRRRASEQRRRDLSGTSE